LMHLMLFSLDGSYMGLEGSNERSVLLSIFLVFCLLWSKKVSISSG
jgi:hypothetical protein